MQSDILKHIQTCAHSRFVSAQGMLVAVLARIITEAGPHVMIPKTIGTDQPFNLGFNLTGLSGAGKSSALSLSTTVLGLDQSKLERELGTGEGLVDSYFVPAGVRGAAPVLSSDPRRLFVVEEVEKMQALMSRQGSSLGSDLRAGLMGQNMGAANSAAGGKSRHISRDTYRLVLVVGTQPAHSEFLLEGASSGFPQRFLWVGFQDKSLPKDLSDIPDDPGTLNWESPFPEFDPTQPRGGVFVIPVDISITQEIQLARIQAEHAPESLDIRRSHLNLTRLKVAAALSALHGELIINQHWWQMAGVLTEHSLAVQDYCQEVISQELLKENAKRAIGRGHAQHISEEVSESRKQEKLERVKSKVIRALEDHAPEPVRKSLINQKLQSYEKGKILALVLEQLIEDEQIEEVVTGGPGTKQKKVTSYKLV